MWLTPDEIVELGITDRWVRMKIRSGEWQSRETGRRGRNGKPMREVALASLSPELQLRWAQRSTVQEETSEAEAQGAVAGDGLDDDRLTETLKRMSAEEQKAWLDYALEMKRVVESYDAISPKRRANPATGVSEFVPAVLALCAQATTTDAIILETESHRAQCPSPYTLDGWLRRYRKDGLLTFLRSQPKTDTQKRDRRKAVISEAAVEWVNKYWRNYRSARHLHKALTKRAAQEKWTIPSEAYFYRLWDKIPQLVKAATLQGQKVYTQKFSPYVPRDYTDLGALQVLCGDHSERDVAVLLRDGRTVARPWLTIWLDLRTYLIWGWHLDLVPSSTTIGMAYADGVRNFGAQPPSRPDDGYASFLYTDQGKDYKSHNLDGKVINVHEHAARIDGGMEVLRVQRRVGLLDDLGVKHLLARGYNAKEKPVERVHRDISDWEQNTFINDGFCGRETSKRPDQYRENYAQHQRFLKGKSKESPFIKFDDYREALAGFFHEHNSTVHERTTLGGARIVPLEELRRLYPTRFDIPAESLALLCMKSDSREIGKNGITYFQKGWSFLHPKMSSFKGQRVEFRYDDNDYSRIWVFLPDNTICEAELVTRTSLLNPNKQTLKTVAEVSAHERKLQREYTYLAHSNLRGETTEDRVAALIEPEEVEVIDAVAAAGGGSAAVHMMTRMDRRKIHAVPQSRSVSAQQVSSVAVDNSIFEVADTGKVKEFDFDE